MNSVLSYSFIIAFFLDSLSIFLILTLMGIFAGTVLGVISGIAGGNVKGVTRKFVGIFGSIGALIGFIYFTIFMDLGRSGHGFVGGGASDKEALIRVIILTLIGLVPIYFLWFNHREKPKKDEDSTEPHHDNEGNS